MWLRNFKKTQPPKPKAIANNDSLTMEQQIYKEKSKEASMDSVEARFQAKQKKKKNTKQQCEKNSSFKEIQISSKKKLKNGAKYDTKDMKNGNCG